MDPDMAMRLESNSVDMKETSFMSKVPSVFYNSGHNVSKNLNDVEINSKRIQNESRNPSESTFSREFEPTEPFVDNPIVQNASLSNTKNRYEIKKSLESIIEMS